MTPITAARSALFLRDILGPVATSRLPLSVTIITHDEERDLGRCLGSVAWADERIVVDSGSTDRTREVAQRTGARVVVQPWLGYVGQKNAALEYARHPWVLSLDADEWLPQHTAAEIRRTLEAPRAHAYSFPRLTALSGGFVRHAWGTDRQVRLFRKDRGRFAGGLVHESVRMDAGATVSRLRGELLHLSFRSLHEYAERMDRYSELAARSMERAGRSAGPIRLVGSPLAAFCKAYVLRLGFLDGVRGLVASAGQAHYVLLKYAKLWERTRPPDLAFARLVVPTEDDRDPGGRAPAPE